MTPWRQHYFYYKNKKDLLQYSPVYIVLSDPVCVNHFNNTVRKKIIIVMLISKYFIVDNPRNSLDK